MNYLLRTWYNFKYYEQIVSIVYVIAFISAVLLAGLLPLSLIGGPSPFAQNTLTALSITFLVMSLIIIALPDIVFDLGEGARKRKVREYTLSSFIVAVLVGIAVNFFTNWVTELPSHLVTRSAPAHSQSTEAPSVPAHSQSTEAPAVPAYSQSTEAPVSVPAFHLPDQMNEATNQDIRQFAYLLNQIFMTLGAQYFEERNRITGSADQIASAELALDERINRDFRQTYEGDFLKLDAELARRLKIDDKWYTSFSPGLISIGKIGNAGDHLVYLANQLP
jgi:hypothetical protein